MNIQQLEQLHYIHKIEYELQLKQWQHKIMVASFIVCDVIMCAIILSVFYQKLLLVHTYVHYFSVLCFFGTSVQVFSIGCSWDILDLLRGHTKTPLSSVLRIRGFTSPPEASTKKNKKRFRKEDTSTNNTYNLKPSVTNMSNRRNDNSGSGSGSGGGDATITTTCAETQIFIQWLKTQCNVFVLFTGLHLIIQGAFYFHKNCLCLDMVGMQLYWIGKYFLLINNLASFARHSFWYMSAYFNMASQDLLPLPTLPTPPSHSLVHHPSSIPLPVHRPVGMNGIKMRVINVKPI